MRALVDAGAPGAPPEDRQAAASALRALLRGASWLYLRRSCGLSQAEVVAHARWSVRVILAALGRSPP